jgi:hypothetical protein
MRRYLILRTSGSEFRGGLALRVFSAVNLRSDSAELNLQRSAGALTPSWVRALLTLRSPRCAPQLWPSLDRIHYYPFRFKNFPSILQGYVDRMVTVAPRFFSRGAGLSAVLYLPHQLLTGHQPVSDCKNLIPLIAWPSYMVRTL